MEEWQLNHKPIVAITAHINLHIVHTYCEGLYDVQIQYSNFRMLHSWRIVFLGHHYTFLEKVFIYRNPVLLWNQHP